MKKTLSLILVVIIAAISLFSCSPAESADASVWDNATYKESTTVGEGSITFKVKIEIADKSITLTVNTDEKILGNALYDLGIINDPTFFDTANGMYIDWATEQAYWGFYIGDTMAPYGVGDQPVSGGEIFRLAYTK